MLGFAVQVWLCTWDVVGVGCEYGLNPFSVVGAEAVCV